MLACALLPLAAAVSRPRPEEQQQQLSAADDHEARAQQSLADMIQDAIAMLKHGSVSAKEQAAGGIAQMAVETTISQPFHPLTFRNACVKAGMIDQLVLLLAGPTHRRRRPLATTRLPRSKRSRPTTRAPSSTMGTRSLLAMLAPCHPWFGTSCRVTKGCRWRRRLALPC